MNSARGIEIERWSREYGFVLSPSATAFLEQLSPGELHGGGRVAGGAHV